jgi:hypothetical protein
MESAIKEILQELKEIKADQKELYQKMNDIELKDGKKFNIVQGKEQQVDEVINLSPKRTSFAKTTDQKKVYANRIVLTTYPGSSTANPIPLNWGAQDPNERGPVVASRHPKSIALRNAIGAHGGAYSIYRALAVAMGELDPIHKPNLHNTEPVVDIPPSESWYCEIK